MSCAATKMFEFIFKDHISHIIF